MWEDHPASAVVSVFNLDKSGWRLDDMAPRLTRCQELIDGEDALSSDLRKLDPGVGCSTPGFVPDSMALATYDDIIARPG
jgi:hypothetical protein